MKTRLFICLTCLLLSLALLAGCVSSSEPDLLAEYTQDNEIRSYQKLDPDKITLNITVAGNVYPEAANARFMELYPNCQIVMDDVACVQYGNSLYKYFANGSDCDLLYLSVYSNMSNVYDNLTPYLMDLSLNPVLQNYHQSALGSYEVDGKVYFLPGPSDMMMIAYNKTMFDAYGWQEPQTYDEFLRLCEQITEDTGGEVVPFNPNAKYASYLVPFFMLSSYDRIFSHVSDWQWLNDFMNGNAAFTGHMEPFFTDAQKMMDIGVLSEEMFTYSAGRRGNEFAEGKIAMCNFTFSAVTGNGNFEIGYMPIPGEQAGEGYVLTENYYNLCAVEQENRSEEKEALVQAYLEFISTVEAQQLFIGDSAMISYVNGTIQNTIVAANPSLADAVENGRMTSNVTFQNDGYDMIRLEIREQLIKMQAGETDVAGACAGVDAYAAAYFAGNIEKDLPVPLGTATETFTIFETSLYFCEKFIEETGADIALFTTNINYRSNSQRIFAGTVDTWDIIGLNPRNFDADHCLTVVEMTGENLLLALNNPGESGELNCVYASAGLKTVINPWNEEGERYLSVTMADGTPVEADKTYRVAIWSGSVAERYISSVVETYPGTFIEQLTKWVTADGTISPASDGRCTLVWEDAR
ncbi:MAG: extracellular solute-binding protein [Bacillota bacterium]|nr:extracellular solute-binding protein [Bacillota bacterium]